MQQGLLSQDSLKCKIKSITHAYLTQHIIFSETDNRLISDNIVKDLDQNMEGGT